MPPYWARYLWNDALLIPCSRQSSATGTPPPARRRNARIWGSLYLVILISISPLISARKFYSRSPVLSGGLPLQADDEHRRLSGHGGELHQTALSSDPMPIDHGRRVPEVIKAVHDLSDTLDGRSTGQITSKGHASGTAGLAPEFQLLCMRLPENILFPLGQRKHISFNVHISLTMKTILPTLAHGRNCPPG